MFYYMSEVVDIKGFSQVVIGVFILVYASAKIGIVWTIPRISLLIFSIFGASMVVTSILIMASSATFWVMGSYPIIALAFKLREFSQYPITIFDGFFRFLFTYLIPIGFMAFYPAQLFLRPDEISWIVYLSPVVGIGLFVLAYSIWEWGVNSYSGTGS